MLALLSCNEMSCAFEHVNETADRFDVSRVQCCMGCKGLHLKRFRQLCPARVSRVHSDEGHDCRLQRDLNVLKDKALLAGTQGIQHSLQVVQVSWSV